MILRTGVAHATSCVSSLPPSFDDKGKHLRTSCLLFGLLWLFTVLPTCIFHYISFTAVKGMARVLAIPMMRLVEASITLEMIMQAAGLRV